MFLFLDFWAWQINHLFFNDVYFMTHVHFCLNTFFGKNDALICILQCPVINVVGTWGILLDPKFNFLIFCRCKNRKCIENFELLSRNILRLFLFVVNTFKCIVCKTAKFKLKKNSLGHPILLDVIPRSNKFLSYIE